MSNPYEESLAILDELSYSINEQNDIMNHNLSLLNIDQLKIYNIIIGAVYDSNIYSKVFLVDSLGWTGKTFLYNTLLVTVRSHCDIKLAVASSEISALLLQGDRTVHSRLRVPIRLNEIYMCGVCKQTVLAKLIQHAKLLVWDEAPMTHRFAAECTLSRLYVQVRLLVVDWLKIFLRTSIVESFPISDCVLSPNKILM